MTILILLFVLAGAAVTAQIPWLQHRAWARYVPVGFAVIASVVALWLAVPVLMAWQEPWETTYWALDRFAALLMLLVTGIYLSASVVSIHYLRVEAEEGVITPRDQKLYATCVPLFVLAMLVTLLANDIGLMWVALETTTLATTLLVSFYRTKSSIEAAWKYIVLCSTGIAFGLFGVLMFAYAGLEAGIAQDQLMTLSVLRDAGNLSPEVVRWAFVFLFVGIGTKVGFVPLHTWLPDAHSKTPSPISGMLSGILLNVAFFMLLRMKGIADASLHSTEWTSGFFLWFGVLSVLLPAFILLTQRNFKRMLAYSSVEHMGLLAFCIGLGPIGLLPAVLHMIGHTLSKSALFYGAGDILLRWKSTKFDQVTGVMHLTPRTGTLFLILLLMLLAAPTSVLFVSEFILLGYGFVLQPWLTSLIIFGLLLAAIGMLRSVSQMLFSSPTQNEEPHHVNKPERWNITHTVMVAHLVLLVLIGVWCLTDSGLLFFSHVVFPV